MEGFASVRAIEIPSETGRLEGVRAFVAATLRGAPWERARAVEHEVVIAVDEAVSNAIEHGYGDGAKGSIGVEVRVGPDEVRIVVTDRGRRFDGVASPPSIDVLEHVAEGRRRGLGLYLIHRAMDEVTYARDGERNALTLVKRLGRPRGGAAPGGENG